MTSTFGDQILAEKLAKLNNSQQSIETLSHWCIFHRKRAAQVVQRWEKEFQSVSRPKKLSFLYLANDILQNSRRKGPEFVNEFWKVLPSALKAVLQGGEKDTRDPVDRLLNIWEERKVFGARDKNLREAFLGGASPVATPPVRSNSKGKEKQSVAVASPPQTAQLQLSGPLEKIATAHAAVQELAGGEDSALRKCNAIVSDLKALEEQLPLRAAAGPSAVAAVADELQAKQGALAKWANQLEVCEKKRSTLVNLLREALRTQESKLERIRTQVQTAQALAEHALTIRHRLLTNGGKPAIETSAGQQNGTAAAETSGPAPQGVPGLAGGRAAGGNGGVPAVHKEAELQSRAEGREALPSGTSTSQMSEPNAASWTSVEVEPSSQSPPPPGVSPSNQMKDRPQEGNGGPSGEARKKLGAAELAAKLASSASSAAMLSSVLSSLAAEGGLPASFQSFGQSRPAGSIDLPPEKRPRLDQSGEGYPGPPPAGAPGGGLPGSSTDLGRSFRPPPPPPSAFMGSPGVAPYGGPLGSGPAGSGMRPPHPMGLGPRPPQPMSAHPPLPHQPPPFQPPPPPPVFGQGFVSSGNHFHSPNPGPPLPSPMGRPPPPV